MADPIDVQDIYEAEDNAAEIMNALRHASRTTAPAILATELRIALKNAKRLEFQLRALVEPQVSSLPEGTAVRPSPVYLPAATG